MGFQPYQVNLLYNQDRNISLIFCQNLQTRDLTLYYCTMLGKSLGISKIIHAASMLSVPETVIKTAQDRIFKFLRKNKKDKEKRAVIYQPFSHGGVNFPNAPHCGKITTLELV